jgi:NAD(P)-dependent dehydrogenase (short-subunit alcohol dehydrogenase family)
MTDDCEFEGKVAFVTGAAHGQGRAVALNLASHGARIAAFDVARPLAYPGYGLGSADDLRSLQEACRNAGSECLTFEGDVRDDAAISAAVEATVAKFGRIDVLFNNAGICAYGLAHELAEAEWDAMIDINLKGAWLVARRVIPVMIAQKSGVIINNSSVGGLPGWRGSATTPRPSGVSPASRAPGRSSLRRTTSASSLSTRRPSTRR